MKIKKLFFLTILMVSCSVTFAYNPPFQGENFFNFTSPTMLSGEASTAGGSLFNVHPEHISLNPALPAAEQRVAINAAYTGLIAPNKVKKYGQAFSVGTFIPSKYGVFTVVGQGAFINFDDMLYRNSGTLRFAFSKNILDDLFVGFGFSGTYGSDWGLAADIGVLYLPGKVHWLPFMTDIRLGFAFTQMGKAYNPATLGIGKTGSKSFGFPSMFTPRFGFAGTLFSVNQYIHPLRGGISFDLSLPSFQNVVFDTNFNLEFFEVVSLSVGWQFNFRETLAKVATYYPTIGLSFKFNFEQASKESIADDNSTQNEFTLSTAFKPMSNNVYAVSTAGAVHFGVPDNQAPQIILWEE